MSKHEGSGIFLKEICCLLLCVIACVVSTFCLLVHSSSIEAASIVSAAYGSGSTYDVLKSSSVLEEEVNVKQEIAHQMPSYRQRELGLANMYYATGTVASNGCGLVSAAAVCEYLTGIKTSPASLLAEVGDSCTDGKGNNDMKLFINWMQSRYSFIQSTDQLWTKDLLLEQLQQGHTVFLSVHGTFGDAKYKGHIVVLFEADSYRVKVFDPACNSNNRYWSFKELEDITWNYCYGIWRNDGR